MRCRYCGDEGEPNRGPGYVDVCPECLGEHPPDDVPRVMAGQAEDEDGLGWSVEAPHVAVRSTTDWKRHNGLAPPTVGNRLKYGLGMMEMLR